MGGAVAITRQFREKVRRVGKAERAHQTRAANAPSWSGAEARVGNGEDAVAHPTASRNPPRSRVTVADSSP